MSSPDRPIPALPIDYLGETSQRYWPAFRVLAILAIVLGVLKATTVAFSFIPYIAEGRKFPSYYPSPALEFILSFVPFCLEIFEVVAGIIAISSANLRPLVIWAWSGIVVTTSSALFNLVWEVLHADAVFKGTPGGFVVSQFVGVFYYGASSLCVPIMVIVLQRMNRRENAQAG